MPLYVLVAEKGDDEPQLLHQSTAGAGYMLTPRLSDALKLPDRAAVARHLETLADLGAFPDYLLYVAELNAFLHSLKGRKT